MSTLDWYFDLAVQALLGMDILSRKKRTMVVTRTPARLQEEETEESEIKINECGVQSHELDDVHLDWLFSDEDSVHGPDMDEDDDVHREDTAHDEDASLDQLHNVSGELISQYQKNDNSLAGVRDKALTSVKSHELDDVHLDWVFSDEDSNHDPDEDEYDDVYREDTADDEDDDDDVHRDDTANDEDPSLDQLPNVSVELISQYQKNDSSLDGVRDKALTSESAAEGTDTAVFCECRSLKRKWKSSDRDKYGFHLALPKQLSQAVEGLAHDRQLAGHRGMEKTMARITNTLYWTGMFGDIQRHCHKKVKSSHDKNSSKKEFRNGVDFLVLLPSDTSKMKARWKGPYHVVCKKVTGVNYEINVGGRRRQVTYHSNLLRQYKRALLLTATVCFEFDGGGLIKPNDAKVKAMADFPPVKKIQMLMNCHVLESKVVYFSFILIWTNLNEDS